MDDANNSYARERKAPTGDPHNRVSLWTHGISGPIGAASMATQRQPWESGMSSTSDDNRFAPPAAHVEDVAPSRPGTLAGRGTRLGAALIDVTLALVAFGILALVTPINIFHFGAARTGFTLALVLQNLAVGFVLFVLIHGYLLATSGQTVGKKLLNIRIVRSDGSPASFGRLVGLRYLTTSVLASIPWVGTVYGLLDTLFIFRASRRCLHDNIADTIVVTA